MIGLLWAAVKFLAPAFGSAFASAAGNQLGTRFADALIPEAVSANVAPAVVARASQRQTTEDDQRVLQPVIANALSQKPDLAASLQSDLDTAAPEIAKQARAIDAAVPPESEAARKFASGVISLDGFYSSLGFTDLHMTYWRDNVCPIGGEPTSVEYFDSLGNQTAMIRAYPNPALTMNRGLVENVTIAKCRAGHSWRVFRPEA